MKKLLSALILASQCLALNAAEIEFAESVPEETVYGSAMTARTSQVWIEMINGAAKTLDFEEFYIADQSGEALEPVIAAVKAAAARGVKVRFIVEKAMMKETSKALPGLKTENIEVRVIEFKKIAGGVQHAKFFIADNREVYVGSQNFDWRALTQIHELGARIKSERAARDFGSIFEADWALAGGADRAAVFASKPENPVNSKGAETALVAGGTVSYRLAFSPSGFIPSGFDQELTELLSIIKKAKKTIRAQVMTYSLLPYGKKTRWHELDKALRAAGKKGVKVELIFADWSMGGKSDGDIKALSGSKNVNIKISSLPPHSRGMIPFARVDHCKYLVADGVRGFVSTSNWSPDYFSDTRGAALIVEGAAGAAVLEDIFARSWNGPYTAPVDAAKEYAPVKKM